jgi:hypothetical protein
VRGDRSGKMYVLFVEAGHERQFYEYVEWDQMRIVCWLDNYEATEAVFRTLSDASAGGGGAAWTRDASRAS